MTVDVAGFTWALAHDGLPAEVEILIVLRRIEARLAGGVDAPHGDLLDRRQVAAGRWVERHLPTSQPRSKTTVPLATASGVSFSVKDRGKRGWLLNRMPPWRRRIRTLVTRGSREEQAREAIADVEAQYALTSPSSEGSEESA